MPALAQATTYYVSKSTANGWAVGSDSNNCTATSTPCLTVGGGVGKLAGGDELVINDGIYTESVVDMLPSGSSEQARTILRCRASRTCTLSGGVWNVRFLDGDSYITVKDLIATNAGSVSVALNATVSTYPTHIRIENTEMLNAGNYCLYTGYGQFNEFLNNSIHDCSEQGVYAVMRDSTFSGNQIYSNGTAAVANKQQNMQIQTSGGNTPVNNIVERNIFRDGPTDCLIVSVASTQTIRRNIFSGCANGLRVSSSVGDIDDSDIDHNVFYNNSGAGLSITHTGSTGNRIRNNIALTNGTNISICGGCGTETTNRTTGVATDLWSAPASGDFRLKAGSAAIDGGTDISLPYNGTAPDQGAFETPTFNACSVENGDPTTIRVKMNNAVTSTLLPLTGVTGFTGRRNAASNTVTAAVATGTDDVFLTVANAYVNGDTIDVSYSAGNLTDAAHIGNTYNQQYLGTLTNQTCVNNVQGAGGGGGTGVLGRSSKGLGLF